MPIRIYNLIKSNCNALHVSGQVYLAQRLDSSAQAMFQRAIAVKGNVHDRQVAESLGFLAELYAAQGKLLETERTCQQKMGILVELYGQNDARVKDLKTRCAHLKALCKHHRA